MREIDNEVLLAAKDKDKLNDLINEYSSFIIKTASKSCGKYITKSSDEWSVSLSAFNQAVYSYSYDKGSFLSFAELVIKRRLIDYLRFESKHNLETSVNPYIFYGEYDENDPNNIFKKEVVEKTAESFDSSIKDEIEAVSSEFNKYGFSFFDLTDCSPKALKTKNACAKATMYIIKNPILLEQLCSSKLLPVKTISKNINVHQKIIERHRKYIIATVIIISGSYPYLAEYMRSIREEQ